jgi:hypothetical protein
MNSVYDNLIKSTQIAPSEEIDAVLRTSKLIGYKQMRKNTTYPKSAIFWGKTTCNFEDIFSENLIYFTQI